MAASWPTRLFLTADDELVIEAREPGGEAVVYEVTVLTATVSVEPEPPTIRAAPSREFCFIEGLPEGPASRSTSATTTIGCLSLTATPATLEPQGPTSRASSSTGCRRSTSRFTRRPGKHARFFQQPARPEHRERSRLPTAASSFTARW
jgi:hypothetical protein